jgi:uncharacterized protein YfaS (alpha-2-macroglobulin family)
MIRNALIGLGGADGWGTTNATAAALHALAASWAPPGRDNPVLFTMPDHTTAPGVLNAANPVSEVRTMTPGAVQVTNRGGMTLTALVDDDYVPTGSGASAPPVQQGFLLTRTLYRVTAGAPLQKLSADSTGTINLAVGDVIEEVDELINPQDRTHVAISLPLPAGLEPLNPDIATAPADAAPSAAPTLPPSFASYGDDQVLFMYMSLPKGTYTVRSRARAHVAGVFTQPPALVETMYRPGISGATAGARVAITR